MNHSSAQPFRTKQPWRLGVVDLTKESLKNLAKRSRPTMQVVTFGWCARRPFQTQWACDHLNNGATLMLIHEFIKNPQSVGSVCSSSPQLGKRMASYIDTAADGWVIELGGGTGSITHEILQHGVLDHQLVVFEKSQPMANNLQSRFPGLKIVPGDAAGISFIRLGGLKIKAIISSLPLRSLPKKDVHRIVKASANMLSIGAQVIQFTYLFCSVSPWTHAGMRKISSEIVWANFPPAKIEVFERC